MNIAFDKNKLADFLSSRLPHPNVSALIVRPDKMIEKQAVSAVRL